MKTKMMRKTSKVDEWLSKKSAEDREITLNDIVYHLIEQEKSKQVNRFLTDFYFLREKICLCGVQKLIEDYLETLKSDIVKVNDQFKALSTIHRILEQSAHLLQEDPSQLPGILILNLSIPNNKYIQKLLKQAKNYRKKPWLGPQDIQQAFSDNPLLKAFPSDHEDEITSMAISNNGKWALSTSHPFNAITQKDPIGSFKHWNIETAQLVSQLETSLFDDQGRKISVNISELAISDDGRWGVISGKARNSSISRSSLIEIFDLKEKISIGRITLEDQDITSVDIFTFKLDSTDNNIGDVIPQEIRIIAGLIDGSAELCCIDKQYINSIINHKINRDKAHHLYKDQFDHYRATLQNPLFHYGYRRRDYDPVYTSFDISGNYVATLSKHKLDGFSFILSYWNLAKGCLEYCIPIPENQST